MATKKKPVKKDPPATRTELMHELYLNLCQFHGLPPYDGGTNPLAGDHLFGKSIEVKFKALGYTSWPEAERECGFTIYQSKYKIARNALLQDAGFAREKSPLRARRGNSVTEGGCNFCTWNPRTKHAVTVISSDDPMRNLSARVCDHCLITLREQTKTIRSR